MQHIRTHNSIGLGCCILRIGSWAVYEYSPFSNRSASAWLSKVGKQMKPLFEFCLKACCIVWSWFSSSLHLDIVVISLPTEPMCAPHVLLFGVNVCSRVLWNAMLSFARCKSCRRTKRSTILSNCDQVYVRILSMCVCLPGFVWENVGHVWHTQIRVKLANSKCFPR